MSRKLQLDLDKTGVLSRPQEAVYYSGFVNEHAPTKGTYEYNHYLSRLDRLMHQIERHCDTRKVGSQPGSEIVLVHEGFCEYCGAVWTEDSESYNGGCCDEDEVNCAAATEAE